MGSATESNAKPQIPMAENDKKTFKKLLKVFFKKDKKKEKAAEATDVIEDTKPVSIATQAVENVLQKIEKLTIKETPKYDDEFDNFSFKKVKDECRNDRSDSHSSEDSGFAEKEDTVSDGEVDSKDDVIDALEKLTIEGKDEKECAKEKRKQTVVISRKPIRNKLEEHKNAPYYVQQKDQCRQIQINKHTLTGGEVIVNRSNELLHVDAALKQVQQTSQHSQRDGPDEWLSIITEVIQGDSAQGKPQDAILSELQRKNDTNTTDPTVEDLLSDFFQSQQMQGYYQADQLVREPAPIMTPPQEPEMVYYENQDPIGEFSKQDYEILSDLDLTSLNAYVEPAYNNQTSQFIFPTPPHSENAASPLSDTSGSYRTSEYQYSPSRSIIASSPERSSPICNSDYEKFQEISHFEESVSPDDERNKERNNSTSSMTMKQYKDLQKEISHEFSKSDCCQMTRKSCKQIFQEHLQKLTVDERKNVCLQVAKMDLKYAYQVMQQFIRELSGPTEREALCIAYFSLLGERVLAQTPSWYTEDFGLSLLKAASLRCGHRPVLTRYLVQCVRAALRLDPARAQGRDCVFHEVDAQGDTLLTALARRGDAAADALAELLRAEPDHLPLFRVHHLNSEGASALHVACGEHSARAPRLRAAHALLQHGAADLWQGDAKAGDTAVHIAVNSKNCDLRLVMVLFKHVDRKMWKKLAHAPNLCSTTPLEYARSATKSRRSDGYPPEVLEFLKKCR